MTGVIDVSRESLEERRRAILAHLGTDAERFWSGISTRALSADEWEAKEELVAIAFLLGEERTGR